METLNWRRIHGQCKILGVVLCASGAIVISLYQGPPLKLLQWHAQVLSPPGASSVSYPGPGEKKTQIKGPLLMFAAFISWSSWVVTQVIYGHYNVVLFIFKLFYPAKLISRGSHMIIRGAYHCPHPVIILWRLEGMFDPCINSL